MAGSAGKRTSPIRTSGRELPGRVIIGGSSASRLACRNLYAVIAVMSRHARFGGSTDPVI
jgi:hypothetical protein